MPANLTASVVEAFSIFESALPQEGRAYYFDIEDALHDLMAKHTDREFMIMGHSLGGGLAQILGARNSMMLLWGPLFNCFAVFFAACHLFFSYCPQRSVL